jgi:drug/metabolite transporter (DMT)-like permease
VLAFGILAVSTASIFIRSAQQYVPSLVIAAYRLSIASLVLAPIALTRRRTELAAQSGKARWLALLSGLFLALHFATWISSLEYTTVASSVVLVSTVPIWVALLSPFTIKEPITRYVWIGMGLTLFGGITIALSDTCIWSGTGLVCPPVSEFIKGRAFLGDILALAGAWMGAGYIIIGRSLRPSLSLISYIFMVYGMAAAVLLVLLFFTGLPLTGYPPEAYLWLILLGLVPQLLGHSSFNWALKYLSAAYVSISMLGEPIGSTILAYFFLGEVPTGITIFGAILILSGIYIASLGERRIKESS